MTIDENHPAVRRLVEKIVKERVEAALHNFLKDVSDTAPMGSLALPDEDDLVESARFDGWRIGIQQGHENLLHYLRYKISESSDGA